VNEIITNYPHLINNIIIHFLILNLNIIIIIIISPDSDLNLVPLNFFIIIQHP